MERLSGLLLFTILLLTIVECTAQSGSVALQSPSEKSLIVEGVITSVDYESHGGYFNLDLSLRTSKGQEIDFYTGDHTGVSSGDIHYNIGDLKSGMRIRVRYSDPRRGWSNAHWIEELWVISEKESS